MNANELVNKLNGRNFLMGRTHCHSENSVKDSLNKVNEMAAKAKELGFDALALTDHGTVTGWQSFVKACNKNGIKPILGVEAYVKNDLASNDADEDENITHAAGKADARLHAIFIGMDDIGRQTISLMTTEANQHIDKRGKNLYPCIDKRIIEKYIAPGEKGYGHVIMTSACVGGVLAGLAYQNEAYIAELDQITKELIDADRMQKAFDQATAKLQELEVIRNDLKEKKDKTFASRIRVIKKKEDEAEREKAFAEIAIEQQETAEAKEKYPEISRQYNKAKKIVTEIKGHLLTDETYNAKSARKAYLEQMVLSEEALIETMTNQALYYDTIVGHGNFYIELQNHGIENEVKWMPVLDKIADQLGIPVVAANDEHMISRDDTEARKYLAAMRYPNFRYEEPSSSDYELYFKSDAELASALLEIIPEEHVIKAFKGISDIIARCDDCVIKVEHHYPKFNADWSEEETYRYLEQLSRDAIPEKYPDWNDEMEKRLVYELGVIRSMGFTDYFLVVQWYVNVGKKLGHMPPERLDYLRANVKKMDLDEIMRYIEEDQSWPGLSVGPGRGSGAGSIVCYLIGITAIDPIQNDLVFERFLNPERVSMPDIDVDFAKFIRDVLIDVVKAKYGQDGVCGIMTRGTLAAKASIQMVAKVYGSKTRNNPKEYLSLSAQMSELIPNEPGIMLDDCLPQFEEKFSDNEDAMEILKIARKLEGTFFQYGQHAAGVVIADNGDIRQYTALMWDPDNMIWKSQMDKDEVEKNGMLKMDFLGLINLDIITDAVRMIEKDRGVTLDLEHLPFENDVIRTFAEAKTDSVFQFESEGMKKMLRQFGPTSFDDLVLLVAAYRPGPMQFLNDVFKVKHGGKVQYLTKELEPILKNTYGQIIYQEQVMQIFRDLAGYSLGGADLVRRAMGHKEMELLEKEKNSFVYGDPSRNITGCAANGIDPEVAKKLFDQMMKFAEYAFNKSHAAAYSYVSYITAYLKYHFPAEYLCTVMAYEDMKKMPMMVRNCHEAGIEVKNPDINISEEKLSIVDNKIYFGLGSIKNVAASAGMIIKERDRGGNFSTVADFLLRTACKKNVFESLAKAGAFDSISADRMSLIRNVEALTEAAKDVIAVSSDLKKKEEVAKALDAGNMDLAIRLNGGKKPGAKVLRKSIASLQEKYKDAAKVLNGKNVSYSSDQTIAKLNLEKDVLGVYLSGSPLDGYVPVAACGSRQLTEPEPTRGNIRLLFYPTEAESRRTKKDGKLFVTFSGTTPIGQVDGVCFNEDAVSTILETEKPVVVIGKFREDRQDPTALQLTVYETEAALKSYEDILVCVKNFGRWCDFYNYASSITPNRNEQQFRVVAWYDAQTDERRETSLLMDASTVKKAMKDFDLEIAREL